MGVKITSLQHVGVAMEATWGVGVAPQSYVPFTSFDPENVREHEMDEGKRGSLTKVHNHYVTVTHATAEIEALAYPDVLGYFLACVLSSITTTGTSPYSHVFKVGNTNKSLTLQWFDGAEELRFAGMIVDEVTISSGPEDVVTFSASMQGKSGVITGNTVPSFSNATSFAGSKATLTIDGVQDLDVSEFEISFKRNNELLHGGNNTTEPTKPVQGSIEVTGSFKLNVESNTQRTAFNGGGTNPLVFNFNGGASNNISINIPNALLESLSFDNGGESLAEEYEFTGIYDASVSGPVSVTLTNLKSSY